MVHHRQRLPLGLEPGDDLLRVHAQFDDLERHATSHRFSLLGYIHHAAPALADALQQLVAPERLAHRFVGRIGEIELDGGSARFGLRGQKRFGLLVRGEQSFQALAQGGVAGASLIQESSAGDTGLEFDGDAKQRFLTLLWRWHG